MKPKQPTVLDAIRSLRRWVITATRECTRANERAAAIDSKVDELRAEMYALRRLMAHGQPQDVTGPLGREVDFEVSPIRVQVDPSR